MALKKLFFSRKVKHLSTNPPTNTDNSSTVNNGCFDCNICLDLVQDPVVTLCGHLYCWPCIYKWFNIRRSSSPPLNTQHPLCPVCKAQISPTSLVPLYGRGQLPHDQSGQDREEVNEDTIPAIPPRPPAYASRTFLNPSGQQIPLQNPFQGGQVREHYTHPHEEVVGGTSYSYSYSSPYNHGGIRIGSHLAVSVVHPVVMFVEMFYARAFGNTNSLLTYSSTHPTVNNARARRHEIQADKSLNRISVFLLCCFVLCLVLF